MTDTITIVVKPSEDGEMAWDIGVYAGLPEDITEDSDTLDGGTFEGELEDALVEAGEIAANVIKLKN